MMHPAEVAKDAYNQLPSKHTYLWIQPGPSIFIKNYSLTPPLKDNCSWLCIGRIDAVKTVSIGLIKELEERIITVIKLTRSYQAT